jgi:phage baseplate assembly protein W
MPVERLSQGFQDISMTFKVNPLTNDLITLKNETSIARSVRNLVMTLQGEVFYNPIVGSRVSRLLFDNMDAATSDLLKDEVTRTIKNYEPRVDLIAVDVEPNFDNNEYNVRISYFIVGIDVPAQQLSFALKPTR